LFHEACDFCKISEVAAEALQAKQQTISAIKYLYMSISFIKKLFGHSVGDFCRKVKQKYPACDYWDNNAKF
jgi:hypothetical protein